MNRYLAFCRLPLFLESGTGELRAQNDINLTLAWTLLEIILATLKTRVCKILIWKIFLL
jgi:hypothetical protein